MAVKKGLRRARKKYAGCEGSRAKVLRMLLEILGLHGFGLKNYPTGRLLVQLGLIGAACSRDCAHDSHNNLTCHNPDRGIMGFRVS